MELLIVKLLCAGLLYGIVVAISASIVWLTLLRQGKENITTLSKRIYESHDKICLFIAGVLFTICFVGLMPLVNQEFERFLPTNHQLAHYIAQVSIVASFLMVWMISIGIEALIVAWKRRQLVDDESRRIMEEKQQARSRRSSSVHSVVYDVTEEASSISHYDVAELSSSTVTAIVLGFSLATHGFLEGLGIGVMSSTESVIAMATVSALHENLLVIAMVLKLVDAGVTVAHKLFLFILLFSLTSPIGVLIGAGLTSGSQIENPIFIGLLRSFATGGILYVVLHEMVPHCILSSSHPPWLSALLMIFGTVIMTAISYIHIYMGSPQNNMFPNSTMSNQMHHG